MTAHCPTEAFAVRVARLACPCPSMKCDGYFHREHQENARKSSRRNWPGKNRSEHPWTSSHARHDFRVSNVHRKASRSDGFSKLLAYPTFFWRLVECFP